MRKHVGTSSTEIGAPAQPSRTLPLAEIATAFVTSEAIGHPMEYIFDGQQGPGATRWVAGTPGEQTLLLAFDGPQPLHEIGIEIEERDIARTQELDVSVSSDGGETFKELVRQEYTFSPPGTSFEREAWTVDTEPVTHVRLRIKPHKGGGPAHATMTAFHLS
jgi:hypothetical protein